MKKIVCLIFFVIFIANKSLAIEACASITPIYSVLSNITEGVFEPKTILTKPFVNLHHYSLTPSEALRIKKCEVFFLIDEDFEVFTSKVKNILKKDAKIVELSKAENVKLLKTREHIFYDDETEEHDHDHGFYDYHIWLDIDNVKAIADKMKNTLIEIDPNNQDLYSANYTKFVNKINLLDDYLDKSLSAFKNTAYLLHHDAYQYFEKRYKLKSLGAIIVGSQQYINARTLAELQDKIKMRGVKCIFKEPQFISKNITLIAEKSGVKLLTINAEWSDISQKSEGYFIMMKNIVKSLQECN